MTCVVEPFYSALRMDGIASTIVGIFMHEYVDFAWLVCMSATPVTMSGKVVHGHLNL